MTRFHFLVRLAAAGLCGCLTMLDLRWAAAEAYRVDSVHSSVMFRIKHLNTSFAWGRFNEISGTVDLDGANGSLDVEVQVDSIDTKDAKRDQHLKGPDFFSAKQFPTISFKSTKVTKTDEAAYDVEGTLTLHGVSRPITVRLERTGMSPGLMGGKILGVAGELRIKRSDYRMKFMLAGLSDEVLVIVSLECAAK